ncbi:putative choline/carnitine O-acetyltransferase [Trypanosoma conorhini]|uniref:Putative choline/carnitine O-acetyltransferase n=1 Tax=Trypanosoma conorhini TaxID=83891 RepID=A0A3R7S2W4_9TRYP|nr:putative choline/carnitine O-acetyltransferase [Trypanosoma conorhini]RNF20048.1 putative choline/carnitine O-acetyltransferase [Trypanosoma conorhini]
MDRHLSTKLPEQPFALGFAGSGSRAPAYLDAPQEYYVATRSPVTVTPPGRTHTKECFSAYGYTDPVDMKERLPSRDDLQMVQHQSRLPRLPIPTIEETCSRFLKSIEAIASAEEYFVAVKLIGEFKAAGGVGEKLDALLREWDQRCGQPSWLEEFWDDAYLCPRDPIPINVNYFFGFSAHPNKKAMTQLGRAASLLHGAVSYHIDIRQDNLLCEFERDKPVCMCQNRFLCCTSRVPGRRRDRKVCYCEIPALSRDELESKSVEYVSSPDPPRHCIVIQRNRFFQLNVIRDDDTIVEVEELLVALKLIEERVVTAEEPGPPVGLLTTMNRTDWFEAREHLKQLGNYNTLRAIQSAIICIALDSVEVVTSDEAARIFLHGSGTNRWFDRHNIIVTRDGWAGANWEHSVADGTATLRLADRMYQSDCEHVFTEDVIAELATDASRRLRAAALFTELAWLLDGTVNDTMKRAFSDYKKMIEVNETAVLRFRHFGGARIKGVKASPDAFLQLAFQLTYYRLLGRAGATYEAASTRTFLHGRTECVRSATRASLDFCRMSGEPIFSEPVGSILPTQRALMWEAMRQHSENMLLAKKAHGIDRHLLGLRLQAVKHGIPLPDIFENPVFKRSAHWNMSTSHCGSSSLSLFGFGPVVGDGFGIGYMVKNDHIDVCITSKFTHPYTSSVVFATILQSSLLHMMGIVESESTHQRAEARTLLFSHPTGFNDFKYDPAEGFVYKCFTR